MLEDLSFARAKEAVVAQFDDKRLVAVLGESATHWKEIKKHLKEKFGELTEEWKFYNQVWMKFSPPKFCNYSGR
ncbi:MAG: hypothetical protein ACE5IY_21800 [bacterium]